MEEININFIAKARACTFWKLQYKKKSNTAT